jgi:hypothetical protein
VATPVREQASPVGVLNAVRHQAMRAYLKQQTWSSVTPAGSTSARARAAGGAARRHELLVLR